MIGETIKITVAAVEAGRVRLAIEAPQDVSILRSELKAAADTNREAARESSLPSELLEALRLGGGAPGARREPPGE